jgi:hypothetical protein
MSGIVEEELAHMERVARWVRLAGKSEDDTRQLHEEHFDRLVSEVRRLKAEAEKWRKRHARLLAMPAVVDALLPPER